MLQTLFSLPLKIPLNYNIGRLLLCFCEAKLPLLPCYKVCLQRMVGMEEQPVSVALLYFSIKTIVVWKGKEGGLVLKEIM